MSVMEFSNKVSPIANNLNKCSILISLFFWHDVIVLTRSERDQSSHGLIIAERSELLIKCPSK